jgi:hypothetical protein
MPRVATTPSVASWFREYYKANRKALKTKSNKEVLESWQQAHPGPVLTPQTTQPRA